MDHSESLGAISAALVKANAQVQHAVKDSSNPHFRSTFASLNSVLDTVKPVYAEHGLAIVQMPGFVNGAAALTTRIIHESGEWIEATAGSPLQKNDPQGVGSALTYLRRYAIAALAGIGQEDDDGNAASTPRSASTSSGNGPVDESENTVQCPKCGGDMWDNRIDKKNPRAPDFKCKDKKCDEALWVGSWPENLIKAAQEAFDAGAITEEEKTGIENRAVAGDPVKMSRAARWLHEKAAAVAS